jgi:hypothetical protein
VTGHAHPLIIVDRLTEYLFRLFTVAVTRPFEEHLAQPPPGVSLLGSVGDALGLLQGIGEMALGSGVAGSGHGGDARRPLDEPPVVDAAA